MTGIDLLILAAESGHDKIPELIDGEAAAIFAEMFQTFAAPGFASERLHEIVQRPTSSAEQSAAGIIGMALNYARTDGRELMFVEVLRAGIPLAMRFAEYWEAFAERAEEPDEVTRSAETGNAQSGDVGFKHMSDVGAEPIEPASTEELIDRLTHASFTTPLEQRNAYANGVLTWAKNTDYATFSSLRGLIFDCEVTRQARAWHAMFPKESVELASMRLHGALLEVSRDMLGRRADEDYKFYFGPDIPQTVEQLFHALVNARTGSERVAQGKNWGHS